MFWCLGGGNSVEGVQGVQSTSETAASLGKSIEDNASTGGGAGSFVNSTPNSVYFAAEGRGGGNVGVNGLNGQYSNSGATSLCINTGKHGSGGTGGTAGVLCNVGNNHGGVRAGRKTIESHRRNGHSGEPGGSRAQSGREFKWRRCILAFKGALVWVLLADLEGE